MEGFGPHIQMARSLADPSLTVESDFSPTASALSDPSLQTTSLLQPGYKSDLMSMIFAAPVGIV